MEKVNLTYTVSTLKGLIPSASLLDVSIIHRTLQNEKSGYKRAEYLQALFLIIDRLIVISRER